MAKKKRNWFNLVKRLFTSDTQQQKQDKKEKSRKWVFLGKLFKVKSKLPSIAAAAAAASSPPRERTRLIDEAGEEQSRHALNVALASAAAAEAAVAAAHVAAEVVWLTGVPNHQLKKETQENSILKIQVEREEVHESAAIRIQSAFRGYLARKALHALKGIVRLQAIIRGRNVRKQAMTTLKCLQTIVNIQSQVCAKRLQKDEEHCNWDQNKHLQDLRDRIIKMDTNSQRRWDGSILTKEEANALFLSKKEATIKRGRIKEYSFSHRNSSETERNKINGRWRYWLEQWVDTHVNKSRELEDLDTVLTSNPNPTVEYRSGKQIKMRGLQKQYQIEGRDLDSAMAFPRRSYHRKQNSLGEDNSFSGSPIVPTYMAATESAKAKARSLSSPKLRPGSFDAYSDSYSPCKNKLYLISTRTNGDAPPGGRLGRPSAHQQRSPSLKNLTGPVKSTLTSKDLSFDSECSLRTWGQPSTFR